MNTKRSEYETLKARYTALNHAISDEVRNRNAIRRERTKKKAEIRKLERAKPFDQAAYDQAVAELAEIEMHL